MTTKRLGSSELEITPVGLGTWAIGGEGALGWGPQEDADSIAAIHRAVDLGLNWIDTAPIYGYGRSEQVVGRALAELGSSRRPLVFTKCTLTWDDRGTVLHNTSEASIRREVEDSLRRLQVDVIDLYQIHWPSRAPNYDDSGVEEAWSTLADLKWQGKVRAIGVSNFDVGQLERVAAIAPVESLQPPYSALMRQIEDQILPYCRRHAVGVIAYSPMHHGMLSGRMSRGRIAAMPESDWRKRHSPAFSESHLTPSLRFVDVLRGIADRHGRSVADVAVAWVLRHPAVTGAIVGARSAAQVDGFVGAMGLSLGDDDLGEIEAALPASVSLL